MSIVIGGKMMGRGAAIAASVVAIAAMFGSANRANAAVLGAGTTVFPTLLATLPAELINPAGNDGDAKHADDNWS